MPGRPEPGGIRDLAWLYCPAARQPILGALLGIESEIAASLRGSLDHAIAHTRLAWWAEECQRGSEGNPSHPLTRELAAHLGPAAPAVIGRLAGLVDLAAWDLARATFENRAELTAYCQRWSEAVLEPLALGTAATAAAAVRALGASLREIELLLSLAAEAHAGRIRLPLDELEPLGMSTGQLAKPPWPEPLAALLRRRHRELRAALAASVAALTPAAQRSLRAVIVWAALAAHHSRHAAQRLPEAGLAREDHRPLDGWRAWRTARRAQAGRARLPAE
jgi:15-cis-phytoene synthase